MDKVIKYLILAIAITSFSSCWSNNHTNEVDLPVQEMTVDTVAKDINPVVTDDKLRQDHSIYYYKQVTRKLIRELGGPDSLHKYQFYLSDSLSLQYIDNVKSSSIEGDVKEVEKRHTVAFTKETPGVFRSYMANGTDESTGYRDYIEIYFDEGEDAYLKFQEDFSILDYPMEKKYQSKGYYLFYSNQIDGYHYKGKGCRRIDNSSSEIYLIVRIEKSLYQTKEVAKGRQL